MLPDSEKFGLGELKFGKEPMSKKKKMIIAGISGVVLIILIIIIAVAAGGSSSHSQPHTPVVPPNLHYNPYGVDESSVSVNAHKVSGILKYQASLHDGFLGDQAAVDPKGIPTGINNPMV